MSKKKTSLGVLLGRSTAAIRDHYQTSAIYNDITAPRAARALSDIVKYVRALERRADFMEKQYRALQGWLTHFSTEWATAQRASMTPDYLAQMRAHVDERGTLRHENAVELLSEIERLHALAAKVSAATRADAHEGDAP